MSDAALDDLERLLDEERATLKAGRIDALAEMSEQRDRLLASLGKQRPDPARIRTLQEKLRRNAALIEANGAGLRSALQRMRALHSSTGPISGYSASGAPLVIGPARTTVERKA